MRTDSGANRICTGWVVGGIVGDHLAGGLVGDRLVGGIVGGLFVYAFTLSLILVV